MILGIRGIEESSVYQGILAEGEAKGRLKEARELLLRIAEKKLGRPEKQVLDKLKSLNDLERLHGMADSVGEVSSWDELLASP